MNTDNLIPYDVKDWRRRLKINKTSASQVLGLSYSHYLKIENLGVVSRLQAWAMYGYEAYMSQQKQQEGSYEDA